MAILYTLTLILNEKCNPSHSYKSKSVVQPCDVEEGEWVQVTGKKNKGKEVLVPAEDNGGVVTAEGAGIPLSPISHP